MSADNMLVILKMEDGRFGVYHVMMPQIENYCYYLQECNMTPKDFPCKEYPWKNPEDSIRDSRPWGIYDTLDEAERAAHRMCCEDIIEYGVEVWCEHETMDKEEIKALRAKLNKALDTLHVITTITVFHDTKETFEEALEMAQDMAMRCLEEINLGEINGNN